MPILKQVIKSFFIALNEVWVKTLTKVKPPLERQDYVQKCGIQICWSNDGNVNEIME